MGVELEWGCGGAGSWVRMRVEVGMRVRRGWGEVRMAVEG